MKNLSKLVIGAVAGVSIALAAATFAHGPGFGYGMGGYGMGPGMMGGYGGYGMGMHGGYGPGMMHGQGFGGPGAMGTRLDTLKGELKLSGDQTKAWDTFETAVRGEVKSMIATHEAMHTTGPNPDAHVALMEQRLTNIKTVQKARTDLYQVLTPEQKTVADRYWTGGPHF